MIVKFSFAYFTFNLVMAACSLVFPVKVTEFVENNLPMKGGWLSIVTYLLFYTVDKSIFEKYEQLVMYTAVLLAVVEVTQVANVVFKMSRFFKQQIDFDKGLL
jgi:phosphatidylserine synthase